MKRKILVSAACLLWSALSYGQYEPMQLTGFNQDVIANGTGNASASTTAAVDLANWDLVAPDFKATAASAPPTAALPAGGTINSVNTPGLRFQLANYTGQNSLTLVANNSNGTLNFATTPTGDVYVLGFAGNGPCTATIEIKFSDNTSQTVTGINFGDWYNQAGFAIQGIGRVDRTNNTLEAPAGNPRLYEQKIALSAANVGKKITGIKVTKTVAGGVLNVLAVTVACNYANISSQPLNKDVCPLGTTSFSVTAANAGSYQWQEDGGAGYTDIADNANYSGATTNNLTVKNVPASFHGNKYRCIISATCGTTISGEGKLIIITSPTASAENKNPMACEGAASSLSVTTTGSVSTYKWQISDAAGTDYYYLPEEFPYSTVSTKELHILKVLDTMKDRNFRCVVTGVCGTQSYSDLMTINITPSPHIITSPEDKTIQAGESATFEATGIGDFLTFYWQASWNSNTPFVSINDNDWYRGTKTSRLQVVQMPQNFNGIRFRCIVKSDNPDCDIRDTSALATLSIETTGIDDVNNQNSFNIYPSPVSGSELFISSSDKLPTQMNIIITDKLGRQVWKNNITATNNTISIPVNELAPGMYYIHASDAQHRLFSERFIKL